MNLNIRYMRNINMHNVYLNTALLKTFSIFSTEYFMNLRSYRYTHVFWSIIQRFILDSAVYFDIYFCVRSKQNKRIKFLLSNEFLKFLCHFGYLVGAEGIYILTSSTIKHKWMKIETRWSTTTEIKKIKNQTPKGDIFFPRPRTPNEERKTRTI